MRKKLMDCVRPGVELVRAKPFTPSRLFITLDLPTFERPRKATSGRLSRRNDSGEVALAMKRAVTFIFWILDFRFWIEEEGLQSKIQNPKSKIALSGHHSLCW